MQTLATRFTNPRWLIIILAAVAVWLVLSPAGSPHTASADHNPPGCTADNAELDVLRVLAPGEIGPANGGFVSPGQKIHYIISVSNHNDVGCDMSYGDVHLDLPGPDGLPSPETNQVDLSPLSNCTFYDPVTDRILGNFPIADLDTCNTIYPAVEYTVDVDPGVTHFIMRVHLIASDGPDTPDDPHDRHAVELVKDLSSTVIYPELVIDKVPDNGAIEPGDPAIFSITVTNIGAGPALDVVIDDELPAGYAWLENPDEVECTITGGTTLHCDVGDLASDESFNVTVLAETDPGDIDCLLENEAFASATNHPEISDVGEISCRGEKVSSVTTFPGGDSNSGSNRWGGVASATTVLGLAGLAALVAARRLCSTGRGAQ